MKLEDVKENRPSEEEIERKLRAYLKRRNKSISEAEIEDTVEYISSLFDDEWIEYTVEEGIGSVDTAIKRWFDDTMEIEDWERQNGPLKKNPYPVKSAAGNAGRIEREGDRLVAYSNGDVFDYIDLNKGDGKIKNWLADMSNIYRYDIPEDIEEEFLGSSRKAIKSSILADEFSHLDKNVRKALGELEDYFGASCDGDGHISTERITSEDEIEISNVCEKYGCDFAVGTYGVTIYPIEDNVEIDSGCHGKEKDEDGKKKKEIKSAAEGISDIGYFLENTILEAFKRNLDEYEDDYDNKPKEKQFLLDCMDSVDNWIKVANRKFGK